MYGTDKVVHHNYHEIYEFFLKDFYDSEGGMIEIGIDSGYSLNMWLNLFKNATIYGADKNKKYKGERHQVYQVDQSIESELKDFAKKMENKGIFFINDDGSHIPEHQLLTFNVLFPILEDGGIYIIEDVETSYWSKNGLYGYKTRYGYKHKKSLVEIFKDAVDIVNDEFIKEDLNTKIQHHKQIKHVMFSTNCIIIVKGEREERDYRFKKNL